jgi:hypothetical protein
MALSNTEIVVKMKRGPDWIFLRSCGAWLKKTHKNVYRLFLCEPADSPDVWIGCCSQDGTTRWFTCEARIGAKEVHFGRGKYVF